MIEDPSGRMRAAIVGVWLWLAVDIFYAGASALQLAALGMLNGERMVDPATSDAIGAVAGLALLAATVAAWVFVGRWIVRVNANAHVLSDAMPMTPAANIWWFAVPIGNLWKPFEGIRATWQISVDPGDPYAVPVPPVMRWWWGLWLASSIVGSVSAQIAFRANSVDMLAVSNWLDVATLVIDVPLAITLITVMRWMTAVQRDGPRYAETFA